MNGGNDSSSLSASDNSNNTDYSHFYDPARIQFYFTDTEMFPLKEAENSSAGATMKLGVKRNSSQEYIEADSSEDSSGIDPQEEQIKEILTDLPYPVWINQNSSNLNLMFHSKPEPEHRKVDKKSHVNRKLPKFQLQQHKPRLNIFQKFKTQIIKLRSYFRNTLSRFRSKYYLPQKWLFEIAALTTSLLVISLL